MTRLTIIVPSAGDPVAFENTLASILQNRPVDCDVVVAQRSPYDDPYELSGEVEFPVYGGARDVVELANAALADADSEFVHLLQCGIEVEEEWWTAAAPAFDDEEVVAVAPLWHRGGDHHDYVLGEQWSRRGRRRIVRRRRAVVRQRDRILFPTFAAGFYRTDWLRSIGGFSTPVPVDLTAVATGLLTRDLGGCAVVAADSRVRGNWNPPTASGYTTGRAWGHLRRCHREQLRGGRVTAAVVRLWEAVAQANTSSRVAHLWGQLRGCLDRGVETRYQELLEEIKSRQQADRDAAAAKDASEFRHSLRRAA